MRNLNKRLATEHAIASFETEKIDAGQLYAASLTILFSVNDGAGDLKLQGSNEPTIEGNVAYDFTPATASWVNIPNATVTAAAGATSTFTVASLCYRWIRATWTRTGGTGTVTIDLNAQGF